MKNRGFRSRPRRAEDALSHRLINIAAHVIESTDRAHPADAVLRDAFRKAGLPPEESREVSRAVFNYFRWKGWANPRNAIEAQIESTLQFARRFEQQPSSFPEMELRTRAIPAWVESEMRISDSWLRSLQSQPPVWLRARRGNGITLAKKLGDAEVRLLPEAIRYDGAKDLFRTPEFRAGEFELQDISSQAVGIVCDPRPGETWWDACAGEGGKTLHLSDLMENKGLIWASDRADWRLQKLRRRAARAKVFNFRSALWNGDAKLPTNGKFDGVLIDAPCSGIGTWQRNPHARWTTTPVDIRELAAVQTRLLANAARALKPDGKLVYSVCTLSEAETNGVCDAFEKQFPGFEPLQLNNPLTPNSARSSRLWLLPQDYGGNGMFIAAWTSRHKKD